MITTPKKIKTKLIREAKRKYKSIFPCSRTEKFKDCFTLYGDKLYFWFDTADQNTHVVYEELAANN